VGWALASFATNGAMPTNILFNCENIQIGDSRAWIIGRDNDVTSTTAGTQSAEPTFGLIDEASKLNLNSAPTNALIYLPNMTSDFADAIVDWRSTNSSSMSFNYASFGYDAKHGPFESTDELRLIYGMTLDLMVGDDVNQNGVLDSSEKSLTGGTTSNPGLLEYTTVYSREPNFHADGSTLTNVNTQAEINSLLQSTFGSGRATQIMQQLGYTGNATPTFTNLLRFYVTSGLSAADYEKIAGELCTTTNQYSYGRVNINTASEAVLIALFMGQNIDETTATSAADTLIEYRNQNPDNIGGIDWMVTALGNTSTVVRAMENADLLTTHAYQFTADIAAVGPLGRGYRRTKFVFDITEGTPKIIFRQDLSRLGWALGPTVQQNLLVQNTP
jgi:DNA uptake protein ComE-like DNA-binding protein